MSTDPARPDDDPGFEPVEEGYAFADPDPPARPPLRLGLLVQRHLVLVAGGRVIDGR